MADNKRISRSGGSMCERDGYFEYKVYYIVSAHAL